MSNQTPGITLCGLVGQVKTTKKGGAFVTVFDGSQAHRVFIEAGRTLPQAGEMYSGRVDIRASLYQGSAQLFVEELERQPSASAASKMTAVK